jgi:plasmid replication initiation protein
MGNEVKYNPMLDENNYVVKANKFIEAKGRLGATEQKLLAALICDIKPSDEDFKEYNLNIQGVGEFIGLKNSDVYERIGLASDNLLNRRLDFVEFNAKGKKTFIKVNLISSARYTEGSSTLTIKIDPELKPYLIAISGKETPFTKYMIKNILKLNSSYSIRLYEILKQWQRVGHIKFELEELKGMLGVDSKSYNIFSEFERNVLKIAVSEINRLTDININYEKIKKGRKIGSIEFKIESKDQQIEVYNKFLNENYNISEIKARMGIEVEKLSSEQVINLYEIAVAKTNDRYDPFEYVRLNYLWAKRKDTVRNIYAYLTKSLEEDYAVACGQIHIFNEFDRK